MKLATIFGGDRSARARLGVLALVAATALAAGMAGWAAAGAQEGGRDSGRQDGKGTARPALSVTLAAPQRADWPQLMSANGSIAAWQEAVIGAEVSGYRLTEVLVNVGDRVQRGQVLARIASDTVAAELAQSKAALAEAQALLAEARANADRARQIEATGALSAQQIAQFTTAAQTALARVNAAQARVDADELRLAKTRVLAPDDGVISARSATVGSLTQPGQELFRLIRGGRLEWRAEVTAAELTRLKPGMAARITPPAAGASAVTGRVRMVAPTVDPQTRTGLVYVDLPASAAEAGARAGVFARGEFELGRGNALTLPQSAVLLREGFSYVYRVEPDQRVTQLKVATGRRVGDRVEITSGLEPDARVVASGAAFLSDGDLVRVVQLPNEAPALAAPTKAAAAPAASQPR